MANTKDTDLLIVSRGGSTFKTPVSDLMGVSGNISVTGKGIDLTVPITDNTNFGPDWDENEQPLGPLYVNSGSGTVHESWDYIGGAKKDAEIELEITPGVSGGYIVSASADLTTSEYIFEDGTTEHTVVSGNGGKDGKIQVVVVGGNVSEVSVLESGYLIDDDSVDITLKSSDGSGVPLSVNLDEEGEGYIAEEVATTGGSGSGLKVTITVDADGKVQTAVLSDPGTQPYKVGEQLSLVGGTSPAKITINEVDIQSYPDDSPQTISLTRFIDEITLNINNNGGGFLDGTYDGSPGFDLSTVYGGSSSGMQLSYVVSDNKVDSVELVKLTEGYLNGDKVYITSNGQLPLRYGLTVTGSEVVTWLGVAQNPLNPPPDKGWVLFTTIASGDDDGFVRKEGDHMFGTLFMDDTAIPAISAKDNIITEKNFSGKNLDVTEYVTGGYLTIAEDASINHNLTIGEKGYGANTKTNNYTEHNELAGYRDITPDAKKVIISVDDTTTIEKEIDDNHFITKAYADQLALGGGGGNSLEYSLNVPPQSDSGSGVDYADIQLIETDLANGNAEQQVGLVRLTPGNNIVLTSDDGQDEIEIAAISTKVIFSETAPPFEEGQLWYNTTDGRIYVGYTDLGNDSLPATDQWVDASPSAINGGDYVYRYGDQVENYLLVNGYFNAKHYDLGLLPDISLRS